jgi:hypothetical protein
MAVDGRAGRDLQRRRLERAGTTECHLAQPCLDPLDRRDLGSLDGRQCRHDATLVEGVVPISGEHPSGSGGAGGNRTPVRQVVTEPDTTIPALRPRRLPHRRVGGPHEVVTAGSFPDVSVLSHGQRSFPAVHPHFCCRAVGIRPRAPLLVTILLFYLLKKIRRRERTAHSWRFIGCPRLTSLRQLGSQLRLPGPNVETSQPRLHLPVYRRAVTLSARFDNGRFAGREESCEPVVTLVIHGAGGAP